MMTYLLKNFFADKKTDLPISGTQIIDEARPMKTRFSPRPRSSGPIAVLQLREKGE